ncbi:MAG: phage head morphogenesis protein, partial [Wolinella sp.]
MMFSFSLPPLENMAYLLAKKPELHFNYDEIMHEAHHRAFTVAKITRLDLLGDIQTSLLLAQKEGKSFEHWKKELKPKLQKKGWWGERDITNPKSGEVRRVNINSRRLQTIYDTNMRVSYAQGRARAQYALEGEIYLRYVAILDSRTRESHRRLHGTILPREHDFWKKNYPPNGWRCRCRVDAYTKDECKKRGWHIAENAQHIAEADWSYDTRGLDEDRELERIYLQKAKRIASLKAPS